MAGKYKEMARVSVDTGIQHTIRNDQWRFDETPRLICAQILNSLHHAKTALQCSIDDPLGPLGGPLDDRDSNTNVENEPQADLQFEQEIYLKKLLIKHALDGEVDLFIQSPSLETAEKTVFLRYLYYKILVDFSPFRQNAASLKTKLENLFVQKYPTIRGLHRKATRDDIRTGKSSLFVDMFDASIITPTELATKSNLDSKEAMLLMSSLSARREMLEALKATLSDVSSQGKAEPLFSLLSNAKSMEDLPIPHRKVFGAVFIAESLYEHLNSESTLRKLKNIYRLTPRASLKALFSVTNPVSVMTNLFSTFLSRPLGQKSLLQRMIEISLDLTEHEKRLKERRKNIDGKICSKVAAWIDLYYDPIPKVRKGAKDVQKLAANELLASGDYKSIIMNILSDSAVLPIIEDDIVQPICADKNNIMNLFQLVKMEMRLRDKTAYVDCYADEELINLLKEILWTVCTPLIELTSKANMHDLLAAFFKLLKGSIAVAESEVDRDKKVEAYAEVLKKFEAGLLPFYVTLIVADDSSKFLENIILWGSEIFDNTKTIPVDLNELMKKLSDQDKANALAEVDEWIKFKTKERAAKLEGKNVQIPRPIQHTLPKLLVPLFVESLKQRIDARTELLKAK